MKKIFKEFVDIEQSLVRFQDMMAQINNLKQQSDRDTVTQKQKADQIYTQTIERIENQKKQVDANYSQILANYKQKRKDIEQQSQRDFATIEQRIRNNAESIIKMDNDVIFWLDRAINEMPPKQVNKVISQGAIVPCIADARMLEDEYNKISVGGLFKRKKIQEFLQKALSFKLYLENEIKATKTRMSAEIQNNYQSVYNKKQRSLDQIAQQEKNANDNHLQNLRNLDSQKATATNIRSVTLSSIDQKKTRSDNDFVAKKTLYTQKVNDFLKSNRVVGLIDRVRANLVGTGAIRAEWSTYDIQKQYARYSVGDLLWKSKVSDPQLISGLQGKLPNVFKNGLFRVPLVFEVSEGVHLFIHYQQYDKKIICEFVQSVVVQRLRCAQAGAVDVYLAEPDKSGQILGYFSAPIKDNEAIGIYNINSKDAIKDTLKKLADAIDEINGQLGTYQNVYEYNQKNPSPIQERCLVLADVGGVIDKEDWDLLKVIWNNGARCGFTVIIISSQSIDNMASLYPHANLDIKYMYSKDLYLISCVNNQCSIRHGKTEFGFMMSKMTDENKKFVDAYRKAAKTFQAVDARFATYFDADKALPYTENANQQISLPIMVKNKPGGGIVEFVMDSGTQVHSVITGGTGAGKSTFLKMMVASIVMKYHPDDVEIWLVDYSKASFECFARTRPPHVRFVALENTKEFTYSFLDYLHRVFDEERNMAFRAEGVDHITDYRQKCGNYSMPRVVLIIDEFHVMAQHTQEERKYAKILENVLREYRKYGLSCVFCDQSSNLGINTEGEQQIANKLAMMQKTAPNEIINTLTPLKRNDISDTTWSKMCASVMGDIWMKTSSGVEQMKAIYISDKGSGNELERVLKTALNRKISVNCDKKVHVINRSQRLLVNMQGLANVVKSKASQEPFFCIGVPKTIAPLFAFSLEQRNDNNILVGGRSAKIGNDVLAVLLLSMVMQGNTRIKIFVDPREKKLAELSALMDVMSIRNCVDICDNYETICAEIKAMAETIGRRQLLAEQTVIMWLGLRDIFDELAEHGAYPEPKEQKQSNDGFEVSGEKYKVACQNEELMVLAEAMGLSIEEVMQNLSFSEEQEITPIKSEGGIYNAVADICTLFAKGGKSMLYHIVAIENVTDLKSMRAFNLENFIHKIGFSMSMDDAHAFEMNIETSKNGEDEVAIYTDPQGRSHSFKPFAIKK